jgi:hypothetical protein
MQAFKIRVMASAKTENMIAIFNQAFYNGLAQKAPSAGDQNFSRRSLS